MDIISVDGWYLLLRWIHFLAGITWIGLLYYFNFVQGEWFKETDAPAKSAAIQNLYLVLFGGSGGVLCSRFLQVL